MENYIHRDDIEEFINACGKIESVSVVKATMGSVDKQPFVDNIHNAIRFGNLEKARQFRAEGQKVYAGAYVEMADSFETLKTLASEFIACYKPNHKKIIKTNQKWAIDYMLENTSDYAELFPWAIQYNNTYLIDYFIKSRIKDPFQLSYAISVMSFYNDFAIYKKVLTIWPSKYNKSHFHNFVIKGNLRALRWITKKGYGISIHALNDAITCNHIHIVKWALKNNLTFGLNFSKSDLVEKSIKSVEMFELLLDSRIIEESLDNLVVLALASSPNLRVVEMALNKKLITLKQIKRFNGHQFIKLHTLGRPTVV